MGGKRVILALAAAVAASGAPSARAADACPEAVTAPAAIVVDSQSGIVGCEKNADTQRSIASTTKLMTVLLALEQGRLSDEITAPRYRSSPVESLLRPPLVAGEELTAADLIRGALIVSANDAAYDLAAHYGDGSVKTFVSEMNDRAAQLGLTHTSYANPIGLDDPDNYSTARDLATLTRTLEHLPDKADGRFFRKTVNTYNLTLQSGNTRPSLTNRNDLLPAYPWVDGVKTGTTTDAGSVLVASGHRRGVHLVAVVMGADSKAAAGEQAIDLLNAGFAKFHVEAAIKPADVIRVPIKYRPGAELPLAPTMSIRRTVRNGTKPFRTVLHVPDEVQGPIGYNQHIGTVDVFFGDQKIATVPLASRLTVPKAGAARKTQDVLTRPWMLAVLGAILIAGALVASRRKQPPPRPRRKETV